ncbi:iron-sulfur cluster biosynthesis family protein [Lacticaseibacillus jixianensis]|uniref:Iron-sulfur cluster biosynthesis family protein n=1 Tax=Lacticaseibacillus jixianensis TaxID=2486012 RepID=A0ABW4BD77_9LACO|nr:iron-sulfur cluster biosynthesis family protein [Lacticaseibacillus jixianensis]
MATIKLSDSFVDLMTQKGLAGKDLALITDDGGGKYSLQGGACSIGTKFTLIVLDAPDPDYQIRLENAAGLRLWTSDYDMLFFNPGLALDYHSGSISIKDNAHALDNQVRIAQGREVLAAFKQGTTVAGQTC